MLSYKNNQNVQPLYDYYVETDLDSFDDQPVDYSKKYSDQDSYEDCRRRKSDSKSNEFSGVSQTVKQNCNDEVKVYCVEGTPLTISSASSFCDLREIGASDIAEKPDIKDTLSPLPNDESRNSFDGDLNKNDEPLDSKQEESPLCKEKEDTKEVKSVTFRSGDDGVSKASSPLMFSRSSSVASLNSFEQQSIIDDRSSVSIFSALTSGLISPSDLPDSPGELMSPALTDKTNSPKIDVTKPDSDDESDNLVLHEKDKIDPEENVDENSNEVPSDQMQCPKVEAPLALDSYKSEDNLEDNELLDQQLEMSNDSLDIDDVFSNPDYEDNSFSLPNKNLSEELSKSDDDSDEDDILLQQCIQLGMPNSSSENICNVKASKKLEYQSHPQNVTASQELSKESDDDSDEDDILLQQCIKLGMPNSSNENLCNVKASKKLEYQSHPQNISTSQMEPKMNIKTISSDSVLNELVDAKECYRENPISQESFNKMESNITEVYKSNIQSNYPHRNEIIEDSNPVKLDDDSDEDDALLQRCIQMGMPESTPNKNTTGYAAFSHTRYSPQPTNFQSGKDFYSQASGKSDEDSDEDDILMQQCIQLGMPNKSSKIETGSQVYKRMDCPSVPTKTNNYQVQNKNEREKSEEPFYYNDNKGMSQFCMPSPYKLHEKIDMSPRPVCALKNPLPVKAEAKNHCIQRGMPKELFEKKSLQPSPYEKSGYDSPVNYCTQNDLRDDCPDGISDGDEEEDDMLEKCIRAGMPSPKITMNVQNRLHNAISVPTSRKLTSPNHHFLPDSGSEADKKFPTPRLPQNQPYAPVHSSTTWISSTSFIDVDSMRIYRTEDTPILSPTASISDLSSLSFNESFLNNSRNSDCDDVNTDSDEDDELLQQCIRSGMPQAKRAVA